MSKDWHTNNVITIDEYREYKKGNKVLKIKELFHEITPMVVTDLLDELENERLELNEVNHTDDFIRLKVTSKTRFKTIDEYINLTFPYILCKKRL